MGRFQIIRKLGEGGVATVHLAREPAANRLVALKRLKPRALLDPEQVDLFLREVRVAARLDHPGIVQVYDVGLEEDVPFISLEYIDGPDLDTVIEALRRADEPLAPALVAHIGVKVCEALAYVFNLQDGGKPLVTAHRDISPSNVLLTHDGQVKLADFGVVRLSSSMTAVGVVKGKWEYFPPEIMTGRPQDALGDQFALGLTLYKLYATEHPFFAPTPQEHFQRARTEDPVPPKGLPVAMWHVMRKAMQRDPSDRYANIERFGEALSAMARENGVRVTPQQLASRVHRLLPENEDTTTSDHVIAVIDEDIPTVDDARREAARQRLEARPEPVWEPDPDDLPTETMVPRVTRSLREESTSTTAPGDFSAEALLLYEQLTEARTRAGLPIELTAPEFVQMLTAKQAELLRERPGYKVRFVLGRRGGKPVVVPKVSRR